MYKTALTEGHIVKLPVVERRPELAVPEHGKPTVPPQLVRMDLASVKFAVSHKALMERTRLKGSGRRQERQGTTSAARAVPSSFVIASASGGTMAASSGTMAASGGTMAAPATSSSLSAARPPMSASSPPSALVECSTTQRFVGSRVALVSAVRSGDQFKNLMAAARAAVGLTCGVKGHCRGDGLFPSTMRCPGVQGGSKPVKQQAGAHGGAEAAAGPAAAAAGSDVDAAAEPAKAKAVPCVLGIVAQIQPRSCISTPDGFQIVCSVTFLICPLHSSVCPRAKRHAASITRDPVLLEAAK